MLSPTIRKPIEFLMLTREQSQVPGRLDYCLWIIDLLGIQDRESHTDVLGIDMYISPSTNLIFFWARLMIFHTTFASIYSTSFL